MDRAIVYVGAIPLETDILNTNKNSMVGLSKLSAAILGTTTLVNGFTCIPTGPASLQVQVTAGEIYSLQNTDSTAYSTLAADTVNQLIKQGIQLGTVTLSAPAPATGGQSINYLVQVTYQDSDLLPVVLPYYNASNPSQAYSGPANAGTTNNTVRKGLATVGIKTGISAATGSQVTPTVDAGYTALFVVSVANGQTQITAPNIATSGLAPFISETLTQKISQTTGDARYVQSANIQNNLLSYFVAAGAADALTGTLASTLTALVDGMEFLGKASAANATTTPTLNLTLGSTATGVKTIVKGSNQPLATGDIAGAGYPCVFVWNSGYNAWVLINPANGVTTISQPIVGTTRNAKMSVAAAAATGTFTADEVIVETALGGTAFKLSSYSQTCNLATTGAGGMDTGTAPVSGFVSLYAISKAGGATPSILACNATTSSGSVYSGANLPATYTASALIGIWPTNGSSQFVAGLISDPLGRKFQYKTYSVIFTANAATSAFTVQSISGAVPAVAKYASVLSATTSTTTGINSAAAGDSTGTGAKTSISAVTSGTLAIGGASVTANATLSDVPLITPQTIYLVGSTTTNTWNVYVTDFSW